MFVITTDGMDNASQHYSSDVVKEMIERQKSKYGWELLFLGANIDAVETARGFGIAEERAVTYCADSVGTRTNFDAVSQAASAMRTGQPIPNAWKGEIEDYMKRKQS